MSRRTTAPALEIQGFQTAREQDPQNLKRVRSLLRYLKDKYNCSFPDQDQFVIKLIRSSLVTKYPSCQSIDGIMDEWNFWKQYLTEESFIPFIKASLLDMFKLHCTSTSFCTNLEAYVGRKAKIKDDVKIPKVSTCVRFCGSFVVNGQTRIRR